MRTIEDVLDSSWQKQANYESEYQLLLLYLEDYTKLFWKQMENAIRLLVERKPKDRIEWAKLFNNGNKPNSKFTKIARSTKLNDIKTYITNENIYHLIKERKLDNKNYWEMLCLAQDQLWIFINQKINLQIKKK
jgi:hypothetical protein